MASDLASRLRAQQRTAARLFAGHVLALVATMGTAVALAAHNDHPLWIVVSFVYTALSCWHGLAMVRVWDLYKAIKVTAADAARLRSDIADLKLQGDGT